MKKNIIFVVVLLAAIVFGIVLIHNNSDLRNQYLIAVANNKAYESQLDVANERNKVFQFTIEQLEYINDSTIRELDSMRKELKIKDSKIKQMGKIREYVYMLDSVIFHDTMFADKNLNMDTTLGDEWYSNKLHLQYPNIITSEIDINTDLSVFLHTARETINPPCKTWLGRLFQRKHDVYNVTVVEQNPYVKVKENKFVIIDK